MKANVLLEEYIGLGRYSKCGGWIGHFCRDRLEAYRLAYPFKSDEELDEDGNPVKPHNDPKTPQDQEAALQEELRRDEERMRQQEQGQ